MLIDRPASPAAVLNAPLRTASTTEFPLPATFASILGKASVRLNGGELAACAYLRRHLGLTWSAIADVLDAADRDLVEHSRARISEIDREIAVGAAHPNINGSQNALLIADRRFCEAGASSDRIHTEDSVRRAVTRAKQIWEAAERTVPHPVR